ncbi:MAG: ATP-binding protein [Candidatus Enteromonas sp.]|nr:ATP-binding protein [Candidatus Enteromonas sp.]
MKKIVKFLTFLVFGVLTLTGCQSTDESNSYMGTGTDFTYACVYMPSEDKTSIKVRSYIQNDTIYTIDSVTLRLDLYNNGVLVKDNFKVTYNYEVKHGTTKDFSFSMSYDRGEVDEVKYSSWTCEYKSVWDSYYAWFVSVIVIASIATFIFVLIMLIEDLELDDVVFFFEDHLWILLIVGAFVAAYIIDALVSGSWSWVPLLIIGGGIVAVALAGLLALGIKYFFTDVFDLPIGLLGAMAIQKKHKKPGVVDADGNLRNIDDLLDDEEGLKTFSKADLMEWCRDHGLTGYSQLNKAELVSFVMGDSRGSHVLGDKEAAEPLSPSMDPSRGGKIEKNPAGAKAKKTPSKKGITFADIAGLVEAKKAFKEKVVMPMEHKELYERFGKKVGGGILLYGLPGTGKTMFAEAASNELDALFIPVKCSDIKSKWYGESEQKVKEIFQKARKAKKAIIFFDEFEAIGAKRTDNSDNGNNDLVPQILAEMQGVGSNKADSTILVIAATNKPWSIDSAFLRPGRFDEKIYIPLPDFEARKKLFELQLAKLPHENDLDFDLLANLTEGCNGADIKEVCEKLKMSAINETLATGKEQTIGMDDVEKIKNSIKSSVQLEEIKKLEEFQRS